VAPCSSHWQHRSRLALGAALLEQGLITQEQLQQLAASIAKQIGIPAGGGASAPASSKPSGNRPVGSSASPGAAVQQHFPPLNIGAGATPQRPGRPKPAKGTPPPGRSRRSHRSSGKPRSRRHRCGSALPGSGPASQGRSGDQAISKWLGFGNMPSSAPPCHHRVLVNRGGALGAGRVSRWPPARR
jgi:hypothetical protein